jgi:uncharacterized BrkB/YihY/UPF0761 family membrane protein
MKKVKRITALIGVVLLVGLYITTLISAIFIPVATAGLFKACVFSTITVPVMLYAYILVYRVLKNRNTPNMDDMDEKK